jgi:hypothetical protein
MSDNLPVDTGALAQILENQKQELTVREKQIELEREKALAATQSDERQYNYALQQLEATERDRHDERVYRETIEKKSFWIFIIFIIALAIFLTTAVIKNKDEMIIELVKIVAYGTPCGFGGYVIGRYKSKNNENKTPPQQ